MNIQPYRWIRNALLISGIGLLLLTHTSVSQNVERSQVDLAADLLSGEYRRVDAALGEIPLDYDPGRRPTWILESGFTASSPLVEALIELLEQETDQYARMVSGEPYEIMPGEMNLSILHTVMALNDPRTIPSLLRNAHTGWGVKNALLNFGPQIMDEAIDCVNHFGISLPEAAGCLGILHEVVNRWPNELDEETYDRITRAALRHLTCQDDAYRNKRVPGRGSWPLAWVLRLAEALESEELTAATTLLADGDQHAWKNCGFDEPPTRLQSAAKAILEDHVDRQDR